MSSIMNVKRWENDYELIEFCNHIISHSERFVSERVFEAKEILNNLKIKGEQNESKH